MAENTTVVEFADDKIVFEKKPGSETVRMLSSTLLDHKSAHMDDSKAELIHSIVAQHIIQGIDVTSEKYLKGLEMGITWHCFHEGR